MHYSNSLDSIFDDLPIEIETTKICSKCKAIKPISQFNKSKGKLRSYCICCGDIYRKMTNDRNIKNNTNRIYSDDEVFKCSICKELKTPKEFSPSLKCTNGLTSSCKVCNTKTTLRYSKSDQGITLIKNRQERNETKIFTDSDTKKCPICKITKPYYEFDKCKSSASGLSSGCKECTKIKTQTDEYKQKFNENIEFHKQNNTNKIIDITETKSCPRCKEVKSILEFNISKRNKSGRVSYCKICCNKISSSPEHKQKRNDRMKEKLKTDPVAKIKKLIRCRLYNALRITYTRKISSAVDELGCSPEFLKLYLETQFQDGMSWDNFGEWQMDHIIPLDRFNLEDIDEFRQACNYTNIQPLWKADNSAKCSMLVDDDWYIERGIIRQRENLSVYTE